MERTQLTLAQMNALLLGVQYGFKAAEKGTNLERAMMGVYEVFEVAKPDGRDVG